MTSEFPGPVPEIPVPDIAIATLHEFTAADPDGNLFRVFYDFATPERAKGA